MVLVILGVVLVVLEVVLQLLLLQLLLLQLLLLQLLLQLGANFKQKQTVKRADVNFFTGNLYLAAPTKCVC